MKTDYLKVKLDLSVGSAYEYNKDSEVPTIIEFGRKFSGKFQEGKFSGTFSNIKLHDIIFLIKRGDELSDIEERIRMVY